MKKNWIIASAIIFNIILLDQITKYLTHTKMFLGESIPIIDNFFNLTYVRNTGVAFGIGAGSPEIYRILFFIIIPILACIWLFFLMKNAAKTSRVEMIAFAMITGGAIGNLIDRIHLGYVIDFFDFYLGTNHFPAFNIADSSITVAAIIIIIDSIFRKKVNASNNI